MLKNAHLAWSQTNKNTQTTRILNVVLEDHCAASRDHEQTELQNIDELCEKTEL